MIKENKNVQTIQENSKNLKALYIIGWIVILVGVFFIDMDTDNITKALTMFLGLSVIIISKVMMWWKHG